MNAPALAREVWQADTRVLVSELVYRSCLLLDARQFEDYLSLCGQEFQYRISTYSPEIRKDMTWLEHDREGLAVLFGNLPKHNSYTSPLTRHATVYTVSPGAASNTFEVVSALQVFRTTLDGGTSTLFAVGKLHDLIRCEGGDTLLLGRNVRLDTRMLGYGYHIPL